MAVQHLRALVRERQTMLVELRVATASTDAAMAPPSWRFALRRTSPSLALRARRRLRDNLDRERLRPPCEADFRRPANSRRLAP